MWTGDKELLISYHRLQQTVGWIAFVMPIAVRLTAYLSQGIFTTNSISAYYYTNTRDVFVGALVAGGIVLAFFRSEHRRDCWLAIVAGVAAIGIALFPMDVATGILHSSSTTTSESEQMLVQALRTGVHGPIGYHFIFVTIFFVTTFYLVAFRFRANTPPVASDRKKKRNTVYVVCGALMGLAFVWIGILWLLNRQGSIFWPETVAVMSFACAWLVKGQLVLKDA